MPRVAIVTDSAADIPADVARQHGVTVIPLVTNFGAETFEVGVDLSPAEFWAKLTAPGSPFPTTAASAPGTFQKVYDDRFGEGAEAVVAVHVASTLSATIKSAEIGRAALPERDIVIVDSWSASAGTGLLALYGAELRDQGLSAPDIARAISSRVRDLRLYLVVETLEYLRRGGRISGATATLGTLLSVKPIITIAEGKVEQIERVRTRSKARERLLELLTAEPADRVGILHGLAPDVDDFRAALLARLPEPVPEDRVMTSLIGASVGAHLGPGCVGAAILVKGSPDTESAHTEV